MPPKLTPAQIKTQMTQITQKSNPRDMTISRQPREVPNQVTAAKPTPFHHGSRARFMRVMIVGVLAKALKLLIAAWVQNYLRLAFDFSASSIIWRKAGSISALIGADIGPSADCRGVDGRSNSGRASARTCADRAILAT